MSLKDTLKNFRRDPVVKLAVGRKEKPEPRETRDALRKLFRFDPLLNDIARRLHPSDWSNVMERDLHDEWYTKYLTNGTRPSHWYLDAAERLNQSLSRAARGKVSVYARKDLVNWCESNTHRHSLSENTVAELSVIEGYRPDGPVTLYRGVMLSKRMVEEPNRFPRNPSVFLEALAHGHTDLMINDRMASWTLSPKIADRFATKNAAGSEYGAMMNWLQNSKKFIDGELGLVLQATFQPKDVVCEIDKIDLGHLAHGSESEFIIHEGNYKVKIIHVYTPTGEINPQQFSEWMAKRNQPAE